MTTQTVIDLARGSFAHALEAAEPGRLVAAHLPEQPPDLILAVGKGALGMLAVARERAPTAAWLATPPAGVASGPHLVADAGDSPLPGVSGVMHGTHPLPGPESEAAAAAALAAVARLDGSHTVLVLVSGGGSSLWSAPRGVDLAEKRDLTRRLLLAGADIGQLNTVRKHLSSIKGGRLAKATRARVLTLALSDVPGDDPGTIASGPTTTDPTTYQAAVAVLDEYGIESASARAHLVAGVRGEVEETPKPGDELEARSTFTLVASNRTLLDAAAAYWRLHGFVTVQLSDALQGDARELARAHADAAAAVVRGDDPSHALAVLARLGEGARTVKAVAAAAAMAAGPGPHRGLVLLSGGEATVTVTGSGRGGRNQEFALWLHHYLKRDGVDGHVTAIVAGSDGVDGNSPAAGAVISPLTAQKAAAAGLSAAAYLSDNDSHGFFARLHGTVDTGPTGTNLNDYRALVIQPTGP